MSFVYTVDVEEWFQVENLRQSFPRQIWPQCESRVEDAMRRLLDLCEQKGVKGTFFVLGWVAKRHPRMVRAIAAGGHEVACHGFNHDMLTTLDEVTIRQDVAGAKALLEDVVGGPINGYRAPNFSITDRALDILADLGFTYDSSVFPFAHHKRYGRVDTALFEELAPGTYRHRANRLLEFVLPMRSFGGLGIPWAGGGYFRLFPAALYRSGVRAVLNRDRAFIFYMHPWEIDPEQPRVRGINASARFRHYVGQTSAFPKLEQLLAEFGGTRRLIDLAERVRPTNPAAA